MNCLDALGFSASAAAEKGDTPAGGEDRACDQGGVSVIATIGGGGKTTLLRSLAGELREQGARVVLATTTHFMPFDGIETVSSGDMRELERVLERDSVACAAAPAAGRAGAAGKLGPSPLSVAQLREVADVALVEADGSKRLPFKLHASHEPVVPDDCARVVYVLGASGFGRPLSQVCHRAELASERLGVDGGEPATPELVARLLADEMARGIVAPTQVIVNQAEDEATREAARAFAEELQRLGVAIPVLAGSIREHELERAAGSPDE